MVSTITLAQVISALVGTVLPIAVALVTSRVASPGLKAVTLLVLAAITSFLSEWLTALNTALAFDASQAGFGVLLTFVAAVAAHFGLWKPAAVTGSDGAVARALPAGVGGRHAA